MAGTKKIVLFYKLTDKEVIAPPMASLKRKDDWIHSQQRTISRIEGFRTVKVTYELFNPEVEQQRKFFNGPVVDYYAIQSNDLLSGEVGGPLSDRTRETLLSNTLGYDVQLLDRKERRRKSTSDFTSTQKWNDFLETLRETEFEPNGYEMPDSEAFWELAKKHGYEQAKGIAIEQLRRRLQAKLKG